MTTEQNYYIAFHSVIVVDMEKERKKEKNFPKCLSRKSNVFIVPRVCHGAHLQTQQQKKKMFLADEGKEKEKPDLDSIQ